MQLSLRAKLILAFLFTIVISITSISVLTLTQINQYSRKNFEQASKAQLQCVDDFINEFMRGAKADAKYLGEMDISRNSLGTLDKFFGPDSIAKTTPATMSDEEKILQQNFQAMISSHPSYSLIYLCAEDGSITIHPPLELKDFDPRTRPWYTNAKRSGEQTQTTPAYQSSTGEPVCSVTSKVNDASGKLIGVLAIDINLSTLTKVTGGIKLGQTGYVLLMESDGTILSDPHDPELNFKKSAEAGIPALENIKSMRAGTFTGQIDETTKMITVMTSRATGWKLAYVIDKAEILRASGTMLRNIMIAGAVLCVVLLLGAWLLANTFSRPIRLLSVAAGSVAKGEYDSLPEQGSFSAEMEVLNSSMNKMVTELVSNIEAARKSSEEAEEHSRQAQAAMREAEEAKAQTETATREGMLQAANSLEEIVQNIASASQELSEQIENSRSGSTMQRDRIAEVATAMDQMTAAILEVAKNASQAADSAEQTKKEAESGGAVVRDVISSIHTVQQAASNMETGLENLGKQAEGIGEIMNVITDIADQTNLLALNAAIEAARAGEAGRGFAVVADEVRKLAEKTMTATKEVGDAVSAIQAGTSTSIADMSNANEMIAKSTELASKAGEALSSIENIVDTNTDQVRMIATASEEQSAATEQINQGAEHVSTIARQTKDSMELSSGAVRDLAQLSDNLKNVIEGLKSQG